MAWVMYLFATIDKAGAVEFYEVDSRDFEEFKQQLQFEHVDHEWDYLREREKRIRKAEMASRLQQRWLERRKHAPA